MPLHNLCKLEIRVNRTVTAHSDIFFFGGGGQFRLHSQRMHEQYSRIQVLWTYVLYSMSLNGWQSRRLVTLDSENRV